MMGYTSKITDGGFHIDIDYNTAYGVSRVGDDAKNDYMFSSAYMESYYEGFVWEQLLLQDGICTTSILDKAIADGDRLVCINSENFNETIKDVDTNSDEYNEIKSSVEAGYAVIIPDKRVKINEWEGTGYIIADLKNYSKFVFKISGGLNGGGNSKPVDLSIAQSIVDSGFSDEFVTSAYSLCQSMYFWLLELQVAKVGDSALALSAACGSGFALAIAGADLCNNVNSLVDIINYRVKMLDNLYDYCTGKEEEAVKGYVDLMVSMVRDVAKVSNDDIFENILKLAGCSETGIKPITFVKNMIKYIIDNH